MNQLADDMVKFRAEKNINQKQLGKLCGLSIVTISHVESGFEYSKLTEYKIKGTIYNEPNMQKPN